MIKSTKLLVSSLSLVAIIILTSCVGVKNTYNAKHNMIKHSDFSILNTYSNIALKNYTDALNDAKALSDAINKFTSNPTIATLNNAKQAWLNSRESYGQSEIFRLANGPIDAEDGWVADTYSSLEGQLNAWPLDENMIDYTIDAKGNKTSGNIIDSSRRFNPGGESSTTVNVSEITADTLTQLNENGGDANVATGYHAIEFLLWGQDQDYSNFVKDGISSGAMIAGQRPLSDYTSDTNAKRRIAYLKAASSKIVADLKIIKSAWMKNSNTNYAAAILGKNIDSKKNISSKKAIKTIYAGMGVFIKSELANERIAVAVLTPSEEDEHSCFSDNTHRDITANYQGFKNILMGRYKGISYGNAPIDAMDKKSKTEILSLMASIEEKIAKINSVANTSAHFDYQIQAGNPQAKVIVKLKNQLRKLGDKMVNVAKANGIDLSVKDVTNEEETKL